MTWSVYQHWDPLQTCVVGRSYPPEFYTWIKNTKVRSLFEKIAIETEEDYQAIINKLESFGVQTLRPSLPSTTLINGQYLPPPMTPRDYTIMIGNTFYEHCSFDFKGFYSRVKDSSWPKCDSIEEFKLLPQHIQDECNTQHNLKQHLDTSSCYNEVLNEVKKHNTIKSHVHPLLNGAYVTRIGKDLYFGTEQQQDNNYRTVIDKEFNTTRNHIVDTKGHSDGTFCPVCPGLIVSLEDIPTYADTFPDWEVVYLPHQSWAQVDQFLQLKKRNGGRWWIPGFEQDQDVVDTVETWLKHWTGYVEETVFDVNMLIIDPKNVMVFNYNKQVFDALDRYGITPHIVPFRHRYFWDGGIHCVTSDLNRTGIQQDYFQERLNV